ncbi:hypothetical protein LCGC14_1939510, partial [marine sediment metagenome]
VREAHFQISALIVVGAFSGGSLGIDTSFCKPT